MLSPQHFSWKTDSVESAGLSWLQAVSVVFFFTGFFGGSVSSTTIFFGGGGGAADNVLT